MSGGSAITSHQQSVIVDNVSAWEKVAKRHPYSVYNRAGLPAFTEARKAERFSTCFGEGLPFRVYDRNALGRRAEELNGRLEQPYPLGYTGHVTGVRNVVGRTYGRQTREAINGVTPALELGSTVMGGEIYLPSEQQLEFRAPRAQLQDVEHKCQASRPRPAPREDMDYASTSSLAYKPPHRDAYFPPTWSEMAMSNCGQPDPYGHRSSCRIHRPTQPRRPQPESKSAGPEPTLLEGGPAHGAASMGLSTGAKTLPAMARVLGPVPAGVMTRPDAWVGLRR